MTSPVCNSRSTFNPPEIQIVEDPALGLSYPVRIQAGEDCEAAIARFRNLEAGRQADAQVKFPKWTSSVSVRSFAGEALEGEAPQGQGLTEVLFLDLLHVVSLGIFSSGGCNAQAPSHSPQTAVCPEGEPGEAFQLGQAEAAESCGVSEHDPLAKRELNFYQCAVTAAQEGKSSLAKTLFHSLWEYSDSGNHFLKKLAQEKYQELSGTCSAPEDRNFNYRATSRCANPPFCPEEVPKLPKPDPSCDNPPFCKSPQSPQIADPDSDGR